MTDHKFTDDDAIKALECCTNDECDECPYQDDSPCKEYLNYAALSLINRQKAEIERLHKENTELLVSATTELHIPMEIAYRVRTAHPIFKEIRAEAIKEFAKFLIDHSTDNTIFIADLPDLVIEMMEDHNESQNT